MLTLDLFRARRLTRAIARSALGRELAILGPAFEVGPVLTPGSAAYDMLRAQRASRGYGTSWLKGARETEGMLAEEAALHAEARAAYKLPLSATTETAEAFGHERMREAAEIQRRTGQRMIRTWDAALDKRTCHKCEGLDGTWVYADQPFPDGEPGGIHARCRCTDTVLPADWVDLDMMAVG